MAAPTTTYTHSIIVNPGESFTLPPGSTILFTTDNSGLESVCAELPTEELACYGFVVVASTGSDGSETETYEDTQITILGYNVGETYYAFDAPVGYGGPALVTALEDSALGAMFVDACTSFSDDLSRQSMKFYVIFKTIPSIGDELQLVAQTSSPNAGAGIPQVQYLIPAKTRATIESDGNDNVCACEIPEV